MAGVKDVRSDLAAQEEILLGGRKRTIVYDLNAFAVMEAKYGSIDNAMKSLMKGKIPDVRFILWAGLIHDETEYDDETGEPIKYNVKVHEVGSWIKTPALLQQCMILLNRALADQAPDNVEDIPGAKEKLQEMGYAYEGGELKQLATVVLTPEEVAAKAEEEAKNV